MIIDKKLTKKKLTEDIFFANLFATFCTHTRGKKSLWTFEYSISCQLQKRLPRRRHNGFYSIRAAPTWLDFQCFFSHFTFFSSLFLWTSVYWSECEVTLKLIFWKLLKPWMTLNLQKSCEAHVFPLYFSIFSCFSPFFKTTVFSQKFQYISIKTCFSVFFLYKTAL